MTTVAFKVTKVVIIITAIKKDIIANKKLEKIQYCIMKVTGKLAISKYMFEHVKHRPKSTKTEPLKITVNKKAMENIKRI